MQLHVRMRARDATEDNRAATPLELFFDLVFVVAVAQAAAQLHHGIVDGHAGETVVSFLLVFFAIWWAWMNFTWFASAYDTDDLPYRLAVFVIMAGVLIVAAGVPRAFDEQELGVITFGYVVMRLAMVPLWLRAAFAVEEGRTCALRYAIGIVVLQVGWIVRLAFPDAWDVPSFLVLAAAELAVPVWAESAGRTTWHPGHIAERYGLFTIIVLGESLLSATIGVQTALDDNTSLGDLVLVIIGGLLIVFTMWWIYFDMPTERIVQGARAAFTEHLAAAFVWGYGQYFVFASVAATGAGLAVYVDHVVGHSHLSDLGAGLAVTVPVSIYLVTVWALHAPYKRPSLVRNLAVPIAVALVLISSATPEPVLITGVVLVLLVAVNIATADGDVFEVR